MRSLTFLGRKQFSLLKDRLVQIIPQKQAEIADIKKRLGDKQLGHYTVEQVIGGMRAIKGLFQDISSVDPFSGVMMRGYTIPQLKEFLPSAVEDGEPLPEGLYWLLMTGELPSKKQFQSIHAEIRINALECDTPFGQLCAPSLLPSEDPRPPERPSLSPL